MSERPFIAARVEEAVNRKIEAALRLGGWRESVVPYTGYGTTRLVRVMARVVLVPPRARGMIGRDIEQIMRRRGWRNFLAAACVSAPVRVVVNGVTTTVYTDRGGYLDTRIVDHGLSPGWQEVEIYSRLSERVRAPIQVVADDVRFGIVSDIDDTIITTWLPRPFIAAWNSFVLTEEARDPVPGMAALYQGLLADHPGAPIIYLSTGSFDTVGFLQRFIEAHGYPHGPLLLTDFGPTNTGWFRSGQDHKRRSLRLLAKDFPKIKWVLVGDDGQHDPDIYAEFAAEQPKRTRVIALRQLSPAELVLSHGSPLPAEAQEAAPDRVPEIRAADGDALRPLLLAALRKKKDKRSAEAAPEPVVVEVETESEARSLAPVPAGEVQAPPSDVVERTEPDPA